MATSVTDYLVRVFYVGTEYYGSQWQPNLRTIQGEIINAVEKWDKRTHSIDTIQLAGRTDKGVHSFGQIGLISTDRELNLDQINKHLPDDISLWAYGLAPDNFKPRFSVLARHYRYYQLKESKNVDINAILTGIRYLIGSNNYALISKPDGDRSTDSTILNASVRETDEILIFDFFGTRFLWKLVRKIVALLVQIGQGSLPPEIIRDLISFRPIAGGIEPAPPEGLVLVESILPIMMQKSKNAMFRIQRYLEEKISFFHRMYTTFYGVNDDFLADLKFPF